MVTARGYRRTSPDTVVRRSELLTVVTMVPSASTTASWHGELTSEKELGEKLGERVCGEKENGRLVHAL